MSRRAKGEGSLYQDKSGSWIYQYKEDGKRRTKRFQKKSDAKAFMESQKMYSVPLIRQGMYIRSESDSTTVEEWMNTWLELYAKPSIKLSTYISYEQYIRGHIIPQIGSRTMNSLRPIDLQNFFTDRATRGHQMEEGKGLSPKTLTNLRNMMHLAFEQAIREGLIVHNIVEDIRLPKMEKQEMRVLTRKEQERLIMAARLSPKPSAFGVVFALFTGVRLGELCALKWENVDMDQRTVRIVATRSRLQNFDDSIETSTSVETRPSPKTESSRRTIPLMEALYNDLVRYKNDQMRIMRQFPSYNEDGYVFCQENGHPYEPRTYVDEFKRCVKRADIPQANFHSLRHTFATRALEQGMDVVVVAKLMGHSDPSVTLKKYAHALPEHQQESMDKLGSLYQSEPEPYIADEGPTMCMDF